MCVETSSDGVVSSLLRSKSQERPIGGLILTKDYGEIIFKNLHKNRLVRKIVTCVEAFSGNAEIILFDLLSVMVGWGQNGSPIFT